MNIAEFAVALVGPVVSRVLASLGLSLITVGGLSVAVSELKTRVIDSIGGLPQQAIELGGLFGIWEAVAIGLAAGAFVVAWRGTAGFWTLAKS